MQMDIYKVEIENKEQFMELVKQLNLDIAFRNTTRSGAEKEPLLNLEYLLKRYHKIKAREEKNALRKLHDCDYCLYYEKPRRCYATKQCPMEMEKRIMKKEEVKQPTCQRDKEGNCPYGNAVGTCFGFCFQEILAEFHGNKKERQVSAIEIDKT